MLPYEETLDYVTRNEKGYMFEGMVEYPILELDIPYVANPSRFEEWKKKTNTGYDILLKLPNGDIKVECKLTLTKIYPCWFNRDWITRTADIFVTNNKRNIPYECRDILEEKGKKLMNLTEFFRYLVEIAHSPNQYTYWNSLFSIYLLSNFVFDLHSNIRSTLRSNFRKVLHSLHSTFRRIKEGFSINSLNKNTQHKQITKSIGAEGSNFDKRKKSNVQYRTGQHNKNISITAVDGGSTLDIKRFGAEPSTLAKLFTHRDSINGNSTCRTFASEGSSITSNTAARGSSSLDKNKINSISRMHACI